MSGTVTARLADELACCVTSKGAVRVPPGAPLPRELLAQLVKARLVEIGPAGAYRRLPAALAG